jgi:hypothetical protein
MTLRFFKPRVPTEPTEADPFSGLFVTRTLPAPQQPSLVRSILVGIVGIAIYVLILVIGIMIGVSASVAFLIWAGKA